MSARTENTSGTQSVVAFGAGALFAVGLAVSGMTLPEKVIGFLDVTGEWDPALIGVMGGAVLLYAVVWRWARRMERPLVAPTFSLPTRADLDARLIGGAAIFGVGWGLSGLCPGPALVSVGAGASGLPGVLVFVVAMILGMLAHDRLATRG
jgi:hypothetical protein